MKKIFLVSVYIVLTILGLILMKYGGNTGILIFEDGLLNFSINVISFLGFISYVVSFLLFTNIVVKFDLSYIMPITTGIVQILTLVSGHLVFNENISNNGIIGAIFVIFGIIVMNIKKDSKKEE